MMEDEVAALVVDNGSGKSESTLECNKRVVVHYQSQTEIMPMVNVGQISWTNLGQNFVFRPNFWVYNFDSF